MYAPPTMSNHCSASAWDCGSNDARACTGIDINDLSTIATLAQAAVARMQTWYEDGVFEYVSYAMWPGRPT